tara:strand:+ start:10906 stop:11709 length:804 start_codon:yes stop_codon:yes gene_type:complete
MLKSSNFLVGLVSLFVLIGSFTANAQLIDYPKSSFSLVLKSDNGTNGSGVAYDPAKQLYYTIIAGNSSFPLEVFNSSGKHLFPVAEAGNDLRGIWWNKKAKSLEGNCYGENGIVKIGLTSTGSPSSSGNTTIFEGSGEVRPTGNSCGVYDAKKKELYYFENETFKVFKRKTGALSRKIEPDLTSSERRELNYTSMIYTGIKRGELGLLDVNARKVYLFNKKTGAKTATINLPNDAPVSDRFAFSYANGYIFLFDKDLRTWYGYKITE